MKKNNPFENFEKKNQPKEIQKSEIFSCLRSMQNPVNVKKTGKEIKTQIQEVILPKLIERKDNLAKQISDFLAISSLLPSTEPYKGRLILTEEEFPYKTYNWDETRWVEKSVNSLFKGFGEIEGECCEDCDENGDIIEEQVIVSPSYPQSKEEAKARSQYNNWVEEYRDLLYDIKTANALIFNLKDEDEYYLNSDQLVILNFDEN